MRLQLTERRPPVHGAAARSTTRIARGLPASLRPGRRATAVAAVAALLALAAAGRQARAQSPAQAQFVSKVQIYVDNDHTQVVSPLVQAQGSLDATTTVSAGYVADAVTSASIDIVTQASKTTIHDTRHQGALSLSKILGDYTAGGGYIYSTENDYRSHNLSASLERRLFGNDATVSLGYAGSFSDVGRAGDYNFHRALAVNALALTVTQILTPTLAMQVSADAGLAHGFQSSPYRFVPVRSATTDTPSAWVAETDPEDRRRAAGVVGANWLLTDTMALQGDYRLYRDDWGITSHTFQLRLLIELSPDVELRLRNRLYTQSGASFYRANYADPERYMTIDRELSSMWSDVGGAKLTWRVARHLEAELKADAFTFAYPDFPLLRSRLGADLGTGLALTY